MPDIAVRTSVLERFLRYVQIDTQSDETSDTVPSTAKQLVLLDLLAEELRALGLEDAARVGPACVFATLPATSRKNRPGAASGAALNIPRNTKKPMTPNTMATTA